MLLRDLPNETEIVINAVVTLEETQELQFMSNIIPLNDNDRRKIREKLGNKFDFCPIAFKENNFFVDFDSDKVKLNSIVLYKGKAYTFERCKVISCGLDDTTKIFLLLSVKEGTKLTRRETYRLFLGTNGNMKSVDDTNSQVMQIKDISINGIGIYIDDGSAINKGDIFEISFKDDKQDKNYNLTVQVIRISQLDEKFLLGCMILKGSNAMGKYINEKQRERLMLTGRTTLR